MQRDTPAVSAEIGLDKVMARIRAERAPARAAAEPAQPSLGERVRGWLAALAPQPLLRPALAGALAVVVVQGIVIANLANKDDAERNPRACRPPDRSRPVPQGELQGRCARSRHPHVAGGGQRFAWPAAPASSATGTCASPRRASAPRPTAVKASPIVDGVARVDALPERR